MTSSRSHSEVVFLLVASIHKMALSLLLVIVLVGYVNGENSHSHHHNHHGSSSHAPVPDCLGTPCTTFKPTCAITDDGAHCEFDDHCNVHNQPLCTEIFSPLSPYVNHCCCRDHSCIEYYRKYLVLPTTSTQPMLNTTEQATGTQSPVSSATKASDGSATTVKPVVATSAMPETTIHTDSCNSAGCVDQESGAFSCADYDQNYAICSHTTGVSGHIAFSQCRKTCCHCGDTIPVEVTATASVASTKATPVVVPSGTPCVDHDVNNNCARLQDSICTATDVHTKNFAVANCANTCGLCAEYFQALVGQALVGR